MRQQKSDKTKITTPKNSRVTTKKTNCTSNKTLFIYLVTCLFTFFSILLVSCFRLHVLDLQLSNFSVKYAIWQFFSIKSVPGANCFLAALNSVHIDLMGLQANVFDACLNMAVVRTIHFFSGHSREECKLRGIFWINVVNIFSSVSENNTVREIESNSVKYKLVVAKGISFYSPSG